MTEVARIVRHPSDRDVVLLHTPHGLSNDMGRFAPARYSQEHRAYVLHNEHIPALYRFARTISLHVVDERRATAGYRTQPVECASCQQPGSLGKPPKVCPSCGETWVPVPPPIKEEAKGRTECGKCRHRQDGRFPFCSSCGARMTYRPAAAAPALVVPLDERRKLRDPEPLARTLERVVRQELPPPKRPYVPESHHGRRVETVDLLDEHPDIDDEEGPDW